MIFNIDCQTLAGFSPQLGGVISGAWDYAVINKLHRDVVVQILQGLAGLDYILVRKMGPLKCFLEKWVRLKPASGFKLAQHRT